MNEYTHLFYNQILPVISILAFGYIIYLLLSRKTELISIENQFYYAIEKNQKMSEEIIETYFETIKNQTIHNLKELDKDSKEQLKQTLSNFEKINRVQQAINYQLRELQQENRELHKEIKKRDAIIERKTKQIQRLKNEI